MNINDMGIGCELTSKSGTKLIFRGKSIEHTWCVICEYQEDTYSKEYPDKINHLKGETGYFEPCDLFPRGW